MSSNPLAKQAAGDSSLDKLIEDFGLSGEYKEKIVGHLVQSVFPAYPIDIDKIGVKSSDYLFADQLEVLGLPVDEFKRRLKEALFDHTLAVDFHKYRLDHFDRDLALEYIDHPDEDELAKGHSSKYVSLLYWLEQLMFDNDGEPFNQEFRGRLADYLHPDLAQQIRHHMEEPLAIIHYLFWNEEKNVRIEMKNHAIIRDDPSRPVYSAELDFYYGNRPLKTVKIVNQKSARSRGYIESLRAYLDINEWYAKRDQASSQIFIPIEFQFGEFGMIRRYYEFNPGMISSDTQRELDEGRAFLYKSKGISGNTMENEFHLDAKMVPPALIILDFEVFPEMP